MVDGDTEVIGVHTCTCMRTFGTPALPQMHVAPCLFCSALGPVHLHPSSSATHAHDESSPSLASARSSGPLVHCSVHPRGASVRRVRSRPRRALQQTVTDGQDMVR
jgi:hypothetical protein